MFRTEGPRSTRLGCALANECNHLMAAADMTTALSEFGLLIEYDTKPAMILSFNGKSIAIILLQLVQEFSARVKVVDNGCR